MSDINWKDGAVCYENGKQWFFNDSVKPYKLVCNMHGTFLETLEGALNFVDFQLNEIVTGDYIPASELDTEQKYNDVVEVFGLFGFKFKDSAVSEYRGLKASDYVACCSDGLWQTSSDRWNKRQLTYNQIIAIGKLKRMMLEREKPKFKLGISAEDAVSALNNAGNIGQKHDQSKPRFSLIPLEPLQDVISVLEFGAAKYGADNWKHVENPQQRYLDAFMRHTMAWQSGELVDEESGLPHLAHAQCCLLFLQHFDK